MINIRRELVSYFGDPDSIQLNDVDLDPLRIKAILINEVVPSDPSHDFYGSDDSEYLRSALNIMQMAGAEVSDIKDVLNMGIYITNAVKTPKSEYTIDKDSIENSIPFLEKEISLFPDVKVIMLLGDVAKKSFNMISKRATKKNAVPSVSTYKLRNTEIHYQGIRVIPSYIITGGNLQIERSKSEMTAEDIAVMLDLIK